MTVRRPLSIIPAMHNYFGKRARDKFSPGLERRTPTLFFIPLSPRSDKTGKVRGAGGASRGTAAKGTAAKGSEGAGTGSAAERREQDFSDLRDSKAEVVRSGGLTAIAAVCPRI